MAERRRLGKTSSSRLALLNGLLTALLRNEKISTTDAKAKELKRYADEIITTAKKGGLSNIRRVNRTIRDKEILKKLFDKIVPAFAGRSSGYTSIIKTGYRQGDRAKTVIIRLVISKAKTE